MAIGIQSCVCHGVMMIKLLKEFQGYAVSDLGQVYTKRSGYWRKYKSSLNAAGYGRLALRRDGHYFHIYTHRLVAQYFLLDWDETKQVNHLDGDKMNNAVSNLEMVTPTENVRHALRMGLGISGERSVHAKLTYTDVLEIRRLLAEGFTGVSLSKSFKVSTAMISRIKTGKNWAYEMNTGCD